MIHEPIFTCFLAFFPLCHSRDVVPKRGRLPDVQDANVHRGIATSAGTAADHQYRSNHSLTETHGVSAQQPALPELRRAGKERSRAKG